MNEKYYFCNRFKIHIKWKAKNILKGDARLQPEPQDAFIPITIKDETPKPTTWQVETLILKSPDGEQIELKSNSLFVVAELLHKMSWP